MSPEQIRTLQHLSRLFEQGSANSEQIRELSELLSTINKNQNMPDLSNPEQFSNFKNSLY